jgi:hypothetical protein
MDVDETWREVLARDVDDAGRLAVRRVPMAAIRPLRIPTSAPNQGLPVPSSTRALRSNRSNV